MLIKIQQAFALAALIFIIGPTLDANDRARPLAVNIHVVKREDMVRDASTEGDENIFRVDFDVRNISSKEVRFAVDSCAYYEAWSVKGDGVELLKWGCRRNIGPVIISIAPGKSYQRDLQVRTKRKNVESPGKFQLCFQPKNQRMSIFSKKEENLDELSMTCSNEAEIEVAE